MVFVNRQVLRQDFIRTPEAAKSVDRTRLRHPLDPALGRRLEHVIRPRHVDAEYLMSRCHHRAANRREMDHRVTAACAFQQVVIIEDVALEIFRTLDPRIRLDADNAHVPACVQHSLGGFLADITRAAGN